MMSPLPQELIDTIVDRVADASDTASLRACLHVSRSFRSRSRMHLFRDVRIDSAAQCARLHALFAMDPTAATLVHKLDVVDPIPRDPRRFKEETWIGRDDLLPGVVEQLAPHLHALDLSSEGYHYGNRDYTHVLRWNKASEALKRALVAVFRGPNIRFVSLAGVLIDSCQMLFSLFDGSPVERLDLPSFWHDAECRVDADISTLHPPRLQSLSIILSTCLVNYLLNPLCAVHLDRLSRISITVPGNCSLEIRSAATAILSDSVEHLILNENIYCELTTPAILLILTSYSRRNTGCLHAHRVPQPQGHSSRHARIHDGQLLLDVYHAYDGDNFDTELAEGDQDGVGFGDDGEPQRCI